MEVPVRYKIQSIDVDCPPPCLRERQCVFVCERKRGREKERERRRETMCE